jgi:hypothetical protein
MGGVSARTRSAKRSHERRSRRRFSLAMALVVLTTAIAFYDLTILASGMR